MTRALLCLRRSIQALSFCFLLYLILQTAFPLELKIPVDLYLRLDPFIGIISLFTQKEMIWRMLPAFGCPPARYPLREFLLRVVLSHGSDDRFLRSRPLSGEETVKAS